MAIIHQQAVMRAESGMDLRKCEGCFVKKDTSGKLVLCGKSDIPLGVVHVGGDEGEDTDYILPAHQGIVGVRLSESPRQRGRGNQACSGRRRHRYGRRYWHPGGRGLRAGNRGAAVGILLDPPNRAGGPCRRLTHSTTNNKQ